MVRYSDLVKDSVQLADNGVDLSSQVTSVDRHCAGDYQFKKQGSRQTKRGV
jgi:hypothetical protein